MDKDTIVAVVLGIAVVMMAFALLGVVAVTGYFYFADSSEEKPAALDAAKPVVDTVGTDQNSPSADQNAPADVNRPVEPPIAPVPPAPPAPVCGNGTKETGEQCDLNSDCSASQVCSACNCVDKPKPTAVKLDKIVVDSVSYWCYRPAFNGKDGIGIKIISLKNTGTSDFAVKGVNTIKATAGETTDEVTTKATTNILVKAGKTNSIYGGLDFSREAPYLFIGSKADVPLKVNIDFGDGTYIDYDSTLTFQDFRSVECG